MNARILLAGICALLAGIGAYDGLEYSSATSLTSAGLAALLTESLPALLVGLLFIVLALMPLLELFRQLQMQRRTDFFIAGIAIWCAICAVLLAMTTAEPYDYVGRLIMLLLPGIVIVLVFGAVAGVNARRR